jgi:hypothetical protein
MKSTSGFSGLVGFIRGKKLADRIIPNGNDRSRRDNDPNERYPTESPLLNEKELVKGYLLFLAVFFAMLKVKEFGLI